MKPSIVSKPVTSSARKPARVLSLRGLVRAAPTPAALLPLGALVAAALSACSFSPEGTASAAPSQPALAAASVAPASAASSVATGEHLVLTAGCHDCHTPLKLGQNGPEPDMTRMLSGHPAGMPLPPPPQPSGPWVVASTATNTAWAGPWGTSFTANLTPDPETGLGRWTKETFVATLKTGRHEGRGREILPPMPIPAYRNFTTEELEAIFAYLQTIPVVQNRVPAPLPPG
jgi:mono/diheme cytochrome c family protein